MASERWSPSWRARHGSREHEASLAARKHWENRKWGQAVKLPSFPPVSSFLQQTGPPAGSYVFKHMSTVVGISHLNHSSGYVRL